MFRLLKIRCFSGSVTRMINEGIVVGANDILALSKSIALRPSDRQTFLASIEKKCRAVRRSYRDTGVSLIENEVFLRFCNKDNQRSDS